MLETCNSCGTVFDVDENILSKNIQWLRCSVCNEKWSVSPKEIKTIHKNKTVDNKNTLITQTIFKDKSEQVKHELASIKSVVEDKTKNMSKKNNPVLDQKNKSVAEIASELSASKLRTDNTIKTKVKNEVDTKKSFKKNNFLPFLILLIIITFFILLIFRSAFFGYSFLYYSKITTNYMPKIHELFNYIKLPILAELSHIDMINFVATFQNQKIKFSGIIKNNSNRPILVPKVKILAVREDRKIILEKVLNLKDKIIRPLSEIKFSEIIEIQIEKENINVKATLLKKINDF